MPSLWENAFNLVDCPSKATKLKTLNLRTSAILDFRGPITGSLKSPCTTSYTSLIEIIALNCLVFEKMSVFCIFATDRQTDRLTDKQTDKRTHSSDALSRCRCRERRRQTPVTGPTIITHRKTLSSRALVYG